MSTKTLIMASQIDLESITSNILADPGVREAILKALLKELKGIDKSTPVKTTSHVAPGILEIVPNYSDKVFVVIGDTKSHKDFLKALGGKFGMSFNVEGKKTPGWMYKTADFANIQVKLREQGIKFNIKEQSAQTTKPKTAPVVYDDSDDDVGHAYPKRAGH